MLDNCTNYLRHGDEPHAASLTDRDIFGAFHEKNLWRAIGEDDPTADLLLGVLRSVTEFE